MADIAELGPHIGMGVYSELHIEEFLVQFDVVTKKMNQIDVKFDVVATFPTTGTVFVPRTSPLN